MPVAPSAGRTLGGKYRLLERVGVGGMSEVYRAEALDSGRIVALKLLLPHRADDPNLAARLFHEAQSGFRIRHPAIVEVLDVGQGEFGPYIAMEFLDGETAARVLTDHGKLSVDAALATLLPVLDALQAAHDAGIVHRDLKPGNVFYSRTDEGDVTVKLLDFGVAKTIWPSGPAPRTSTGVVMGTPDYLSPEQANGELQIDGRSDVFSAGVVLFELLTCQRPFRAPTAVATAYRIAHARTPLVRECGGPPNPTLQAIMERALAKRPEERYPTARDLAAELQTLAPNAAARRAAMRQLFSEKRREREISLSGERLIPRSRLEPDRSASTEPAAAVIRPSQSELTPLSARRLGTSTASGRITGGGSLEVRGAVLRSLDQYVKHVFGVEPRQRALAALPRPVAQEFEYDSVQAIVLYDVKLANDFLECVTRDVGGNNPAWARAAGAASVSGELAPLLRSSLRPDATPAVLRRLMPVMGRMFGFGTWELETSGSVTSLRVTDFEAAGAALRLWVVGVLDGALSASNQRARGTIARGEVGFSPQLVVDYVSG